MLLQLQECFNNPGKLQNCGRLFVFLREKRASAANYLLPLLNTNTNNPPALLHSCLSWGERDTSVPSLSPHSLFNAALEAGNYRDVKSQAVVAHRDSRGLSINPPRTCLPLNHPRVLKERVTSLQMTGMHLGCKGRKK